MPNFRKVRFSKRKSPSEQVDEPENIPAPTEGEPARKRTKASKEHYVPAHVSDCCKEVREPKQLCMECFEVLLEHYRPTCKQIQSGKVKSRRHDIYKTTLKAKRDLDCQRHSVKCFSEEQHEFQECWLLTKFFKDPSVKHIDYGIRVLSQEFFIRVFMDVNVLSDYCEAEKQMAFWGVTTLPDPAVVKEACKKMDELVVDELRKNGQN